MASSYTSGRGSGRTTAASRRRSPSKAISKHTTGRHTSIENGYSVTRSGTGEIAKGRKKVKVNKGTYTSGRGSGRTTAASRRRSPSKAISSNTTGRHTSLENGRAVTRSGTGEVAKRNRRAGKSAIDFGNR